MFELGSATTDSLKPLRKKPSARTRPAGSIYLGTVLVIRWASTLLPAWRSRLNEVQVVVVLVVENVRVIVVWVPRCRIRDGGFGCTVEALGFGLGSTGADAFLSLGCYLSCLRNFS